MGRAAEPKQGCDRALAPPWGRDPRSTARRVRPGAATATPRVRRRRSSGVRAAVGHELSWNWPRGGVAERLVALMSGDDAGADAAPAE